MCSSSLFLPVKSETCDPTDTLSQLTDFKSEDIKDFKSEDIKDFDSTLGTGGPPIGSQGSGPGGVPPPGPQGPDGVPRGPGMGPGMGPGGPDGQFPNGEHE